MTPYKTVKDVSFTDHIIKLGSLQAICLKTRLPLGQHKSG
jgi:hypothetical protein